ncbi:MAG: phage tail protein [Lachnospiraceae bacterium]
MDQKNLTFGVGFGGLSSAIDQLNNTQDAIMGVREGFVGSQEQSQQWGAQTSAAASTSSQGLSSVIDLTGQVGDGLSDTGAIGSQAFSELGDAAHRARDSVADAGEAAGQMGSSLQDVGRQAGDMGDSMESSLNHMGNAFRSAGADAQELGSSVSSASRSGLRDHDNMTSGIQRGMNSAVGNSEKRMGIFGKFMKKTAEVGTKAFKGPAAFIQEKFYGALEKVGNRLNGLEDESGDAGDSLKKTGEKGTSAGNQIADAIGGAVKAFAAFQIATTLVKAGFSAVKNFASSLLEAGVNAEQVGAKFEAAFEGTEVAAWADNYATAINRSETEVKSFLTSNKKMYNELGITGSAADDLSKITTSLAYDLGSAFKIDDAEALSVMQDYIGGNTKALAEYGIQIDDAVLKQTALDMGLGSNIDALDDAAAAQVRMSALMEKGTKIQQEASKKQDGYANSIKSMKGIWSNFVDDAAQKFAPVFSNMVGILIDSWPTIEPVLMGFVTSLGDGLTTVIPIISSLASDFLPGLMDSLSGVGSELAPLAGLLLDLATTAIPPLLEAVAPLASVISNLATAIFPPFATIVTNIATTVVPPLVAIIKSLSENVIQPLIPHLTSIVNAILPALSSALSLIPPALEIISPILSGIGSILSTIIGYLSKIVEWAAGGLGSLLDKVGGLLGGSGGGSKGTPHNALGTNNFPGGPTYVNEEGGEMAILPSGTTILPADRSKELIESVASGQNSQVVNKNFNPTVTIQVNGNMDSSQVDDLEYRIRSILRELKGEMDEDDYTNLAIQFGNT